MYVDYVYSQKINVLLKYYYMKQTLFKKAGLLLIEDEGRFMLYGVPKDVDAKQPFEMHALPFLAEPQMVLEVYPEANLIVTQDKVLTLDGSLVLEHEKDVISVELVSDKWLIVQDSKQNNDARYRLMFWDKQSEHNYIWGRYLLRSEKYFAVYTSCDMLWCVYTYEGTCVLKIDHEDADFLLEGDFLVSSTVGNHSVYSLLSKKGIKASDCIVFSQQPLVLISRYYNFGVCANMRGEVIAYYCGEYRDYGKVEKITLYDRAGLLCLKINGRFFLYRFNGEKFAENVCPYGADAIAYNEDDNTLLINTNGILHLFNF